MIFRVLTLFPEQFEGFISTSIIGRAIGKNAIQVEIEQIRDFSIDKHKKVDDAPFGGGAGMVMAVQPLRDALMSKPRSENSRVIYMSPRGTTLTHEKVVSLSTYDEITIVCGHYEGVDQRFIDRYVDEEISIGDYVLTGGELAAMVLMDSVSRMVDSVLKNDASAEDESFVNGLLEYPHYTRPVEIDGDMVPEVLLSGHHAEIAKWRLDQSLEITKSRRPDLFEAFTKKVHDKQTIKILKKHL
ncbi:MAG TPA: tRNA (guanosine(37)-N1)-methyltransferase TrmD [Clostridiales bacterium UBA8960]|nr:tRNA (guanosine(37)-N1)-methyltransferase TrmD [Clostridiales bacterium UBA8960]